MLKLKKITPILILISIILFHGINNYIWLKIDTTAPSRHESAYLTNGLMVNYILKDVLPHYPANYPDNNKLDSLISLSVAITPSSLFQIISAFFDTTLISMRMVNMVFFIIMLFSVYGIGKKIFNKNVGLMSAFLLSMYPIMFGVSRIYSLDIALIAMVCTCIYFLMLSDFFNNTTYSILFGISFGLGMITKIMFPIYLIGPLIFYLYLSFIDKNNLIKKLIQNRLSKETKKIFIKKTINCGISALLGALPPAIFFLPDITTILTTTKGEILRNAFNFGFKEIFFYIIRFLDSQIFLIFFIIFIISFIFFIKNKPKNKKLLIYWLFIPLVILTLLDSKTFRYSIPVLPVIALISSYYILSISNPKIKKAIIYVTVLFSFLQFFVMSYSINFTSDDYNLLISPGANHDETVSKGRAYRNIAFLTVNPSYINRPIKKEDWKIQQILDTIESNSVENHLVLISIFGNLVADDPFIYYKTLNKKFNWLILTPNNFEEWHKNFDDIDFIISKSGCDLMKEERPAKLDCIRSYNHFEKNLDKFELLKIFKLPDNYKMIVYKRKK